MIVTGEREAVFYFASNGEIEILKEFRVPDPFPERQRIRSVLKQKKNKIVREFNKDFLKEFKNLIHESSFDLIYIFSPEFMHKMIEGEIPADFKHKIKNYIAGDFCHTHPFEILKRIVYT